MRTLRTSTRTLRAFSSAVFLLPGIMMLCTATALAAPLTGVVTDLSLIHIYVGDDEARVVFGLFDVGANHLGFKDDATFSRPRFCCVVRFAVDVFSLCLLYTSRCV